MEGEGLVSFGGVDVAAPLGYTYNRMKFLNASHQLYESI